MLQVSCSIKFRVFPLHFPYLKKKSIIMYWNTWEMEEWVRKGLMFSVQRSAQQAISTVATISTPRALHRDQWTTWWPACNIHTMSSLTGLTISTYDLKPLVPFISLTLKKKKKQTQKQNKTKKTQNHYHCKY